MSPLISIIVPVYNAAAYLERCLNSLINQDYPNTEIILINDGSTDESLSICQKYKEAYPDKIRLYSQVNKGASLARKYGIEESRGEYLMFADSDDYVFPTYVSTHYAAIKRHNAPISISQYLVIKPQETVNSDSSNQDSRLLSSKELFKRFFKYEFWGYGGGCYKKSIFTDILYPEATVYEDYFVKLQLFTTAVSVAYVENPLYIYEKHEGSLSNQKLSSRALGEFDNALLAYLYSCEKLKMYHQHAIAIVAESACKWLGILNNYSSDEYQDYKKKIISFARNNICTILASPNLLWKIKIVLIINLLKSL